MMKESTEIIVDEHQDYIEIWFQEVIKPQYYSLLQHLLMPKTSRLVGSSYLGNHRSGALTKLILCLSTSLA
jgi:hypothetical protein